MSKPREFWIFKGDSNFCQELEYDIDADKDVKAEPDGFYDIVSTKDTVEGGIHVIELPAGAVVLTREMLREAFERLNLHVPYNPEYWKASMHDLKREIFGKDESQ